MPSVNINGGTADPNHFVFSYNALGQKTRTLDANGTVHEFSFDVVGRMIKDAVTSIDSKIVDDNVRRLETKYDSAGRAYLFTSYTALTGTSKYNEIRRTFNGFGQLTKEEQKTTTGGVSSTTPAVEYAFSETVGGTANHSRLLTISYPVYSTSNSSRREIDYNYDGVDDDISRVTSLSDDTVSLEELSYLGLGTIVKRVDGDGLATLDFTSGSDTIGGDQYHSLDRFGRIIELLWTDGKSNALDHFKYGYDENGNRMYRSNELDHNFDELYHANGSNGYDGLNQLTDFARGELNNDHDTISTSSRSQNWDIDALGNFDSVTSVAGSSTITENRAHDAQNRLNTIVIGMSTTTLTYDGNGNMTTDELGRTYKYDAWNRLLDYNDNVHYRYDSLGRRNRLTYTDGATTTAIHDLFYSANWQVLEERYSGGSGDNQRMQYVWSPAYVDGLITRYRDTNADSTYDEQLYALADANWNIMTVVNSVLSSGATVVVERHLFDPYGKFEILDDAWGSTTVTVNWDYFHQGGRFDAATALYSFRHRDYSPNLGRWVRMDPPYGSSDRSNLYVSLANSPFSFVDPFGLADRSIRITGPQLIPGDGDIVGKSFGDIFSQLDNLNLKLGDDCVENLTINAHSNYEGMGIGTNYNNATPLIYNDSQTPQADSLMENNVVYFGEQLNQRIKWCKKCTIWLDGCHAGNSKANNPWPQKLAQTTGCEVKAAMGFGFVTDKDGKIIGSKPRHSNGNVLGDTPEQHGSSNSIKVFGPDGLINIQNPPRVRSWWEMLIPTFNPCYGIRWGG